MKDNKKLIKALDEFLNDEADAIQTIDVSDDPEPEKSQLLLEEDLKIKNIKWRIHKNDKDAWPSNPHAHDYEGKIKLHLGTGEMFSTVDRKSVGYYNEKRFLLLRDKVTVVDLPALSYGS